MRPYYDQDGITIYHGDCRGVGIDLKAIGLVLTDPPYGISHPTNYKSRGRGLRASTSDYPAVAGDSETFDPSWITSMSLPMILWGANYYSDYLPPVSGWLVWDKRTRNDKGSNDQADGELAWTNTVKGVRIFRHMWNGMWRDSESGCPYHPTQKPAALMRWCLSLRNIPMDGVVLDPYMGSGPVLVAAKNAGRRAIGIEIEERYCEIAAKRLSQKIMDFG